MVRFRSAREGRLWCWTAAVVAAIYSTLGLARTLSDHLRNRELFDTVFFFAFIVLVAVVVMHARRRGRDNVELFAIVVTAIVVLMMFLRMVSPIERSHLIEYGAVALLIHEALVERSNHGGVVPVPAAAAVVAASVVGTVDEVLQLAIPSRVFDPIDIAVNALAAGVAVGASTLLSRLRVRRRP